MREQSTVRGLGSRLERKRLIWRFRCGAAGLTIVQTLVQRGDHAVLSWAVLAVLVASIPVSAVVLRRASSEAVVGRTTSSPWPRRPGWSGR